MSKELSLLKRQNTGVSVVGHTKQQPVNKISHPCWRTIAINTGLKTGRDFRIVLSQGMECGIGERASMLLDKIKIDPITICRELRLAFVTPRSIGITKNERLTVIFQKALSLGFRLCPEETGPQLRRQYRDQRAGEFVLIGMKPILINQDQACTFSIERYSSGEFWLHTASDSPDTLWYPNDPWIFLL